MNRYPVLAGKAISTHVQTVCSETPGVQALRHRRKRLDELAPSANKCRNQLQLKRAGSGAVTIRRPGGASRLPPPT
eukprot:5487944-Prymnesium_polylepis.1